MKPLKKSERWRFDDICRKIRTLLDLEHWKVFYEFSAHHDEDNQGRGTLCCFHAQIGRRIHIEIGDEFWKLCANDQVHSLLHEHCHAMQNGYLFVEKEIVNRAIHNSEWRQWHDRFTHANEQYTDHLESLLYDLLKDKL
jgi:hypothetical protein